VENSQTGASVPNIDIGVNPKTHLIIKSYAVFHPSGLKKVEYIANGVAGIKSWTHGE